MATKTVRSVSLSSVRVCEAAYVTLELESRVWQVGAQDMDAGGPSMAEMNYGGYTR